MDPNEIQETTPEVAADQTASPAETEGASSSDAAAEEAPSVQDAVMSALVGDDSEEKAEETAEEDPKDEAPAEPEETTDPAAEAEQTPQTDDEDDDDRIPEEEFKALPDGVRRRLGKLNSTAKKAQRDLAEANGRIEAMQSSHDNFTQIQGFVQEHRIEPQNVTLAFDAMARLSRGDHAGFLEAVKPFYEMAQQAVGGTVSSDLQSRVDEGYLTEADAKALTAARAQQAQLQARLQQEQNLNAQRVQQDQQARHQQSIVTAVSQREAALRQSDPDYALKEPAVKQAVQMILANGAVPQSVEQAQAMVDQAYGLVNQNFVKPKPVSATPPRVTSSTVTRSAAPAKSAQAAVIAALTE